MNEAFKGNAQEAMRCRWGIIFIVGLWLVVSGALARAEEQAQADEVSAIVSEPSHSIRSSLPFEVRGFLQTNESYRPFQSHNFVAEFLKAEQRAQLEIKQVRPGGEIDVKADFIHEEIENDASISLREGYLARYWKSLDVRIGRQVITWGTGDLVFITDVFPKNWESFITGAPIEYLKKGSDALRINLEKSGLGLEGIFIPEFQRDNFPSSRRLSFFEPFPKAAVHRIDRSAQAEAGLRIYKTSYGFSNSLYLFIGRDPSPITELNPASSTAITRFGKLNMIGFSTQGNTKLGLLSAEIAYYGTEDTSGTNPFVNNPSIKTLLGIERTLKGNQTLGFQFTQDWMLKFENYFATLPPGFPSRDNVLNTLTLRWRDSLKHDKLKPTVFGLYNFNDRDWFLIAETQVEIRTGAWFIIGARLFGGKERHTMFGQFQDDSNLYLTVRYAF